MDSEFRKRARNRTYEGLEREKFLCPLKLTEPSIWSGGAVALAIHGGAVILRILLLRSITSGSTCCDMRLQSLSEKEAKWEGSFIFIQGADCQYGMIDDMAEKSPIGWQEEIRLTRIAVDRINQMKPKPKFFVVCGDLVHAFPDENGRREQEQDFMREFAKLDPSIPLVCCCGNHDVGNTPTPQSIQHFRNTVGDDFFTFWAGGVKCLVLNSQYYEDPSQVKELSEEQSKWLDRELNGQGCKHLITFQHIPWFLQDPDEGKDYFNIEKELRHEMLEKFHQAGVKTIFCGHYHRNAGGFYKDMEEVVTSAMGSPLGPEKSGLRVVTVTENDISHKYYAMDEIPLSFKL